MMRKFETTEAMNLHRERKKQFFSDPFYHAIKSQILMVATLPPEESKPKIEALLKELSAYRREHYPDLIVKK